VQTALYPCRKCGEAKPDKAFSVVNRNHGMTQHWVCTACQRRSDLTWVAPDKGWTDLAACKDTEEAYYGFFSSLYKERVAAIRKYCDVCPVLSACAEFGAMSGSTGVWGGRHVSSTHVERARAPERKNSFNRHLRGVARRDIRERVVQLYAEGRTQENIANEIGRGSDLVGRLLREAGVTIRPPHRFGSVYG